MQIVIDIPEDYYNLIKDFPVDHCTADMLLIKTGTPLKGYRRWSQLKETILEIKDNNEFEHEDVTILCRFLLDYMDVLERESEE